MIAKEQWAALLIVHRVVCLRDVQFIHAESATGGTGVSVDGISYRVSLHSKQ